MSSAWRHRCPGDRVDHQLTDALVDGIFLIVELAHVLLGEIELLVETLQLFGGLLLLRAQLL